jgi:hypothetical protein
VPLAGARPANRPLSTPGCSRYVRIREAAIRTRSEDREHRIALETSLKREVDAEEAVKEKKL